MKTLILTDNALALEWAKELAALHGEIDVCQSPKGSLRDVPRVDVRSQVPQISQNYRLVVSIHCKQVFPAELVRRVRCVNVHPGFSPFNRGWFPHVFSIMNGMKAGATIHEMDEQLDHGPIIAQTEYEIKPWDTSGTAYANIMRIEKELLFGHFPSIRAQTYRAQSPGEEGNINYARDFESLRRIDLNQRGAFRDLLNRLRALTHDELNNAYFIDESGRRIYVRVILVPEHPGDGPATPAEADKRRLDRSP